MAITPYKVDNDPFGTEQDMSVRRVVWVLTSASPQGAAVCVPEWFDKTVEIDQTSNDTVDGNGQLAAGSPACVIAIQGSNTGVVGGAMQNPLALSNAAGGSALSGINANKIAQIVENPMFIAPVLSTPGTNAVVKVTLLLSRNNPSRT